MDVFVSGLWVLTAGLLAVTVAVSFFELFTAIAQSKRACVVRPARGFSQRGDRLLPTHRKPASSHTDAKVPWSLGAQPVVVANDRMGNSAANASKPDAGVAGRDNPVDPGRGGYVLISPCRDEAQFMRQTLDTVIQQSVRPAKWIIVDDGSTDQTPQILSEYSAAHSWIEVVTRSDRGRRAVGPGVVEAFYTGYAAIDPDNYEYLCKLDLDLRLPPRYFEILMERMKANPRIATCSGKAYVEHNGLLIDEIHGDDTSLGMTKFYRMSCFKAIGGFVREVMWDGIDCHRCRMNGWIACSWDEPQLRFIHLRPMGSSQQSIYTGRMRHGYGQYFMGTGFIYITASAIYRMNKKPYVLGGLAIFWGWLKSALQGKPRYADAAFREFLRGYQWRVLLVGKQRALEEIHRNRQLSDGRDGHRCAEHGER